VCWGDEYKKIKLLNLTNKRYVAKEYFNTIKKVKSHTSMDINGKNGAVKIDLRKPIEGLTFDVITNFGTTEHVESSWPKDQYMAFKNIHDMCKVGGIMFHQVPKANNWQGKAAGLRADHCPYYYYEEFFEKLARLNKYEIFLNTSWNHDIGTRIGESWSSILDPSSKRARYECASILIKTSDNNFCSMDEFKTLKIQKPSDINYSETSTSYSYRKF
tara:strand:- start:50 stop:697 length:648 start_codon:yes stop_codon:yes gene_type:complete